MFKQKVTCCDCGETFPEGWPHQCGLALSSSPTGYLADSSFYANSSGGKKYHLMGEGGWSKCGGVLLNEDTKANWNELPTLIKCKRCIKAR